MTFKDLLMCGSGSKKYFKVQLIAFNIKLNYFKQLSGQHI